MNASATFELGAPALRRSQATGIGLWVFIAVGSTLFALFLTAYAMRMLDAPDWSRIAMPWQLWLSTLWLAAGSLALHAASKRTASQGRLLLQAGGACAVAFVLTQWSAWQALQDARVALAGTPAASFFYLLTALHALHVVGGLVAWGLVRLRARPDVPRPFRAPCFPLVPLVYLVTAALIVCGTLWNSPWKLKGTGLGILLAGAVAYALWCSWSPRSRAREVPETGTRD